MATRILVCKISPNYRSNASIKAKIVEIDAVIDELMNSAMKSVAQGNIAKYELDTGQTRTKIEYTTLSSVSKAIEDYEGLRQMYVNKLNRSNSVVRLMDEGNFKGKRR